jgi:hypothetical protein
LLVEPAGIGDVATAFVTDGKESPLGDIGKELGATLRHLESLGLVARQ